MESSKYKYNKSDSRQRASHTVLMEENAAEKVFSGDLQSHLGHMVWEAGSKQVQETFKSYGRIDLFRPYFDIEPNELRSYLLKSFVPGRPHITSSPDLYGPSMIVLTMVALLLFNMKSSGFVVPNGTLMGTALFACFGSWLLLSGALYFICFLFGADISLLHLVSAFGYSLTSHCVVLFLSSLFHPLHDHFFFFVLLTVFCLPSAVRVSLLVCVRTHVLIHRLILAGTAVVIHLIFIIYLHFGFHVILEEIDFIMDGVNSNADTISDSVTLSS